MASGGIGKTTRTNEDIEASVLEKIRVHTFLLGALGSKIVIATEELSVA